MLFFPGPQDLAGRPRRHANPGRKGDSARRGTVLCDPRRHAHRHKSRHGERIRRGIAEKGDRHEPHSEEQGSFCTEGPDPYDTERVGKVARLHRICFYGRW